MSKETSSYGTPYKRKPSPKMLAHLKRLNKSRRKPKVATKKATKKSKPSKKPAKAKKVITAPTPAVS